MIKKKIVFVTVFVVILCIVVGFVVNSIISSQQQGSSDNTNDNQNTQDETNSDDSSHYLINVNCEDITLFEEDKVSVTSFIITNNISKWKITLTSISNNIEIDKQNFEIKGKIANKDPVQVKIIVEPNFPIENSQEYEVEDFPIEKTFNVTVLPKVINLSYAVEVLDINEFNVKISSENFVLRKNELMINNLDKFKVASIAQTSSTCLTLKSVKLENALEDKLSITYSLKKDSQTEILEHLLITIKQDASKLKFNWYNPKNFNNILYVTRDNKFDDIYPNAAIMSIDKNFDLLNSSAEIILISGNQSGLLIDELMIVAKNIGDYVIGLKLCGVLVKEYSINVLNIEVHSINLTHSSKKCYVNEDLDLTLTSDEINVNPLAVYDIFYEVIEGSQGAHVSNESIFVATVPGTYVVRVYVGNKSADIVIKVEEKEIKPSFAILDGNKNELRQVNLTIEELLINPETFINCQLNDISFAEMVILVNASKPEKIIDVEFNNGLGISLLFDLSEIQSGDNIVLIFEVEQTNERWEIELLID